MVLILIYGEFGLEMFKEASELAWYTVLFAFLVKRLSRRPDKYRTPMNFTHLLCRFIVLGKGAERRYLTTLMKSRDIHDSCSSKDVGCMNCSTSRRCPETIHLQKLQRKDLSQLTDDDKKFLEQFGRNLKICGASVLSILSW
jgi:hypothetical protein